MKFIVVGAIVSEPNYPKLRMTARWTGKTALAR